jgi:RNA polymerase sigma factor (sigma-70 family)
MEDPDRERRFLALLNANLPALGRLAGSYVRSAAEREDLLQDIALALWQALPRFRGECSERTFLFRIAHNHCIDHITRRRPMASLQDMEIDPVDGSASIETRLNEQQDSARLMEAVRPGGHGLRGNRPGAGHHREQRGRAPEPGARDAA